MNATYDHDGGGHSQTLLFVFLSVDNKSVDSVVGHLYNRTSFDATYRKSNTSFDSSTKHVSSHPANQLLVSRLKFLRNFHALTLVLLLVWAAAVG